MSVKVQGNRWCDRCKAPVVAVKSTHRMRNSAVAVTAPLTGGLSLAGAKRDPYVCAQCGGPTQRLRVEREARPLYAPAWLIVAIVVAAAVTAYLLAQIMASQ